MEKGYPVCLDLNNKPCLVIGGGAVACRKVTSLLEYGATVRVITIDACLKLQRLAEESSVDLRLRPYEDGDEDGHILVFSATGDADVNRRIYENCQKKNIWLNAADDPPNCDFYVPAQLQYGPLSIAVSTSGNSPVLAAHIKDIIAEHITKEYGILAGLFGEVRADVNASGRSMEEKKALYESLLSNGYVSMLKTDAGEAQVRESIRSCISSWLA